MKTYEALGRAFVLTPRDEVFKNLDKVNSDTEQKITVLEVNIFQIKNINIKYSLVLFYFQNTKQYLEGNLKESENNLREMVQRKRDVGGDKENQPGSSKD